MLIKIRLTVTFELGNFVQTLEESQKMNSCRGISVARTWASFHVARHIMVTSNLKKSINYSGFGICHRRCQPSFQHARPFSRDLSTVIMAAARATKEAKKSEISSVRVRIRHQEFHREPYEEIHATCRRTMKLWLELSATCS